MLHAKTTNFISELQKYFSSSEKSIQTLFTALCSLKISGKLFQSIDKANCTYSGLQKLILLLLFPLFDVKDISHYRENSLYQLFNCGKDVFYRFINNANFSWRKLSYHVNIRLLKQVEKSSYTDKNGTVRCLIADDTDLPKRGRRFELLSRIYSHVTNTFNYGFKGLFLIFLGIAKMFFRKISKKRKKDVSRQGTQKYILVFQNQKFRLPFC